MPTIKLTGANNKINVPLRAKRGVNSPPCCEAVNKSKRNSTATIAPLISSGFFQRFILPGYEVLKKLSHVPAAIVSGTLLFHHGKISSWFQKESGGHLYVQYARSF